MHELETSREQTFQSQSHSEVSGSAKSTLTGHRRLGFLGSTIYAAIFVLIASVLVQAVYRLLLDPLPDTKALNVQVHVQSVNSVHKLPTSESSHSLIKALNQYSGFTYSLSSGDGPVVYATIAEDNRHDLVIDGEQVAETSKTKGPVVGFVIIMLKSVCEGTEKTMALEKYLKNKYNVESVAFICSWNGFNARMDEGKSWVTSDFTQRSFESFDQKLLERSNPNSDHAGLQDASRQAA